ncbi:DUF6440 family protein [Staphylococcus hyicus]|uniref:DUF6440 family protein n=1 Tax=Staphylococcus hyicus TaxID=1284 RepID=UPI003133545B
MFKNERFHVEKCSHSKGISCYILTDKETGIQYLSNWTGAGGGITPLLDKNGHISKSRSLHFNLMCTFTTSIAPISCHNIRMNDCVTKKVVHD